MKKIYIVLTYTGTVLSKVVKMYTKKDFSHVSIALDEDLNEMYSFGRIYPYTMLPAGFIHENKNKGTFKRFKDTKTRIYSLQVEDEQYDKVVTAINEIKNDEKEYRFNIIGLFSVAIHLKFKREKAFYCAEFVKYVLDKSDIDVGLPELIKPEDFDYIKGLDEVYTGLLREYNDC